MKKTIHNKEEQLFGILLWNDINNENTIDVRKIMKSLNLKFPDVMTCFFSFASNKRIKIIKYENNVIIYQITNDKISSVGIKDNFRAFAEQEITKTAHDKDTLAAIMRTDPRFVNTSLNTPGPTLSNIASDARAGKIIGKKCKVVRNIKGNMTYHLVPISESNY